MVSALLYFLVAISIPISLNFQIFLSVIFLLSYDLIDFSLHSFLPYPRALYTFLAEALEVLLKFHLVRDLVDKGFNTVSI